MADEEDSEREVLTSLPRSRPVRRSAKRAERSDAEDAAAAPRRKTPTRKPAAGTTGKASASTTRKASAKAARSPRPRPTEEARPRVAPQRKVPPAGYAPPTSADDQPSSGATEILMTAVQAATELAQIGFSVGRQALRAALERLPKP